MSSKSKTIPRPSIQPTQPILGIQNVPAVKVTAGPTKVGEQALQSLPEMVPPAEPEPTPLSEEFKNGEDLRVAELYYNASKKYSKTITEQTARLIARMGVNRARYGVVYPEDIENKLKFLDGKIK